MPNNPGDNRDMNKGSGSQQGGQGNKGSQNTGSQPNQPKQGQQGQQCQQGQNQPNKQSSGSSQGQSMGSGSSKYNYQQQSAGKQSNIRLQLTPEQQAQVRRATGRDASSLELSVHDIEDSLDESGESKAGNESGRGEDESNTGSESEF